MEVARFAARFFDDGGAGWLWAANDETEARFGYPIDHHNIGLPDAITEELDRLAEWHVTALNWDYPPDPGPWREPECVAFNAAVATVLRQLRAALASDWEIIDESKPEREDPDLDRYLADPGLFRRDR